MVFILLRNCKNKKKTTFKLLNEDFTNFGNLSDI